MSRPETDLAKEWQKWMKARAKGLVKGDFPYAEELLEHRKSQARKMSTYVPLHLEVEGKPAHWPHRKKRAAKKKKK